MQATPLFKPAENTSAFLKMGLLGFQGSGKTKTGTIVARGLVKHMEALKLDIARRPVFFLDTETGSDWVRPDFDADKIGLEVAKTRAFVDLLAAVKEAEARGSVLVIDSISHFWKELMDSYAKAKARQYKRETYKLQFQDWAYIKGEWSKFTDLYINSNLHIVMCGRAGYEYDYFEGDDGKKELEKTGVKMKAEGEMGYEPSLLVMMERHQKIESNKVVEVWREANVLKDRSTLLDGKSCVDPEFKFFLPHIRCLNLGGKQLGVDTSRTSEHTVPREGHMRDSHGIQRKIVLDELQTLLVEFYPSTTKEDKAAKIGLLRKHFGNEEMTWTKIEEMLPLIDLRLAYDSMYRELKNKPSQYAALFDPARNSTEIDDELPDHSAPPSTPSLMDKLRNELTELQTIADCVSWGLAAGSLEGLTDADRIEVATLLLARQNVIGKANAPAVDKPKPKQKPAAKVSAAEALAAG